MKKTKRQCSVCRKTGHDKRKCPIFRQQKQAPKRKSVLVKVTQKYTQSPYVVNLRNEPESSVWQGVQVFTEKPIAREKRVTVNLGEMVRAANLAVSQREFKVKKLKTKRQIKLPTIKWPAIKLPKLQLSAYLGNVRDNLAQTRQNIIKVFTLNRLAYSTIVILLIALLPFPTIGYYNKLKDANAQVVEESTNAFLSLQSSTVAAFQSNLTQAQYDLNSALDSFSKAETILEKEHGALVYAVGLLPIVGKQVNSRQHLLTAGHHLALGNTYLVKGISESEQAELALTDRFEVLANHLHSAIPQYQEALEQLSAVDQTAVPVEYQQSFSEFKLLFAALINDMTDLVELVRAMDSVFGADQFKRYLLVFQNNSELRATGGFMGSFAVLDLQKGKLMNLDIPGGGSYDLQGQLDTYLKPPLPLQLTNARWEFQDANWFPDFVASAQKIEWFYEQARGTTVDGVIAINASVLERLLKILGPVVSEEQDLEIASEDAVARLQYEVEVNYDKAENQPKKVLADLAGQFLAQMKNLNADNDIRLLAELHEALQQKEIQVYFNDDLTQKRFRSFGWTGELFSTSIQQDYLAVVGTNLQGQKSDARIKQVVEHQAAVQPDGSVVDTVVIHKKHLGIPGELFYGSDNIHYVRVYVPRGSELIEAGGFVYPPEAVFHVPENWYEEDKDLNNLEKEVAIHANTGTRITEEFDKTVFGNWMIVPPGESGSIYFTYKLPFKVNIIEAESNVEKWQTVLTGSKKQSSRYSLVVQKQSGINYDFTSQIIYPVGWQPVWQTGTNMVLATNGAEFNTTLETDEVIGLVMEKK